MESSVQLLLLDDKSKLDTYDDVQLHEIQEDPVQGSELSFIKMMEQVHSLTDIQDLIQHRKAYLLQNDDTIKLRKMNPAKVALLRSPAILLTLALEIWVGLMIAHHTKTLEKHILLASFIPVLSSVSGNVGLQASTCTMRSIATGYTDLTCWKSILKSVGRECWTAGTIAMGAALGLFVMGFFGSQDITFALCTAVSILFSATLGGFFGSMSPIVFKKLNLDPTITAGPIETALQDFIGITIYLTLAKLFL